MSTGCTPRSVARRGAARPGRLVQATTEIAEVLDLGVCPGALARSRSGLHRAASNAPTGRTAKKGRRGGPQGDGQGGGARVGGRRRGRGGRVRGGMIIMVIVR